MSMDDSAMPLGVVVRIRHAARPARWKLWEQSPGLITYCLIVETTAAAATFILATALPPSAGDLVMFGVLAGLGVFQAEVGRKVERIRRRVDNTPHINLTSVWTYAGVLLLPPALVAALVSVLYTHLALRSWYRLNNTPIFRTVFNASLAILTCYVSYRVLTWMGVHDVRAALELGWPVGAAGIALAAAAYYFVGAGIALPGLNPAKRTLPDMFGGIVDNLLEIATLCFGALVGLVLATPLAPLAVFVMPGLWLLHRTVLVKQLQYAANHDDKTGLFNNRGWSEFAEHALANAEGKDGATLGVLMVDLDHFKRINDTWGHLAGDIVLERVGQTIKAEVRAYDCVGRSGGEEFVIVLPEIPQTGVRVVAERIRRSIERLEVPITIEDRTITIDKLSVSIGVANYPEAGTAIEKLLRAADTAMYMAKQLGRNQVVIAPIAISA